MYQHQNASLDGPAGAAENATIEPSALMTLHSLSYAHRHSQVLKRNPHEVSRLRLVQYSPVIQRGWLGAETLSKHEVVQWHAGCAFSLARDMALEALL